MMWVFLFHSHDNGKIRQTVQELGVEGTEEDYETLKKVCGELSKRAASLAAAGLATIVEVIIIIM